MRVAAYQFDVRRGATDANLAVVEEGLSAATRAGDEWVVLPEMWPSSFPGPNADLEALVAADARAWERVARRSKDSNLVVCGSGFGDASGDKPRNRWRLVAQGVERAHYDKVHLFSPTAEAESFSAGLEPPPVLDLGGVRVSGLVCYDLRFPELTRRAFHAGAVLMCVSAQWPSARASHWRALCLGLAVTNQCFVVACNRTGVDVIGRRELTLEFPGNSLIVDPHGEVLAEGRGEVGCVRAELDLERARALRRKVPVERDARSNVYAAWGAPDEVQSTPESPCSN